MAALIDLTGRKFGKLTVIERGRNLYFGKNAEEQPAWVCQCECGNIRLIPGERLRWGRTKSCGCAKSEYCRKAILKRWEEDWSERKRKDEAQKIPFIRRREWPGNFREAAGRADFREDPYALMDALEDREKQILIDYYEFHKPFAEIGKTLGVSKQWVFAIHKKAIEKIKNGKPGEAAKTMCAKTEEPRPLPGWVKSYMFTANGIERADRKGENMNKM